MFVRLTDADIEPIFPTWDDVSTVSEPGTRFVRLPFLQGCCLSNNDTFRGLILEMFPSSCSHHHGSLNFRDATDSVEILL